MKRTACGPSSVSSIHEQKGGGTPKEKKNLTQKFHSAWLNIIAAANKESPNKLIGINDLLQSFYETYGRSFFTRYDYENVSSSGAALLVARLDDAIASGSLGGTTHTTTTTTASSSFTIERVYDFSYTDPIDGSVSSKQGQVMLFDDGSRVVFRLSGTGSQGATVRMYVERYVSPEDLRRADRDEGGGLEALIEVALSVSGLNKFLDREKPTVITVSHFFIFVAHLALMEDLFSPSVMPV